MKMKRVKILIIIIIVIGILGGVGYYWWSKYSNRTLDEKAVSLTKKYVKENSINSNSFFIGLEKLKSEDFNSCYLGSGVLVTLENNTYQYKPYLKCNEYESVVNNNNSFAYSSIVILNQGEEFINNENIEIYNIEKVNNSLSYVNYRVGSELIKKVVLYTTDKTKNIDGTINNNYPTITLNGDKVVNHYYKNEFADPGFVASDYLDGDITNRVLVKGSVIGNTLGEYLIEYTVFNSKGNYAYVQRIVHVIPNVVDYDLKINYDDEHLSKEKTITINITGKGYQYIVLPDNKKDNSTSINYKVTKNGDYSFIIYDVNDNYQEKTITIKNIDDIAPVGTCTATFKKMILNVSVDAKDSGGIKNYKYYVGANEALSDKNTFEYESMFNSNSLPTIQVEIFDKADNSTKIKCSSTDKTVLKVVKDVNGYNCLEGFVCYKQKDYSTTYQATGDGPGPVSRNGCLPTSLAIIAAGFGLKSKNNEVYTPPTLINEIIYPDGRVWGYSTFERIEYVADKLGLKVQSYNKIKASIEILKTELRKGNLIVFNVLGGCYSTGAHYLTIIGINDNDEIFVSDPWSKTTTSMAKTCKVNTWSSIEEFRIKGEPLYFAVISKK